MNDHRARDEDAAGGHGEALSADGAGSSVAVEVAEIDVPSAMPDPRSSSGFASVRAVARVVNGSLGAYHPRRPRQREFLTAPEVAAQLREGEIIVFGHPQGAEFAAKTGFRFVVCSRDQVKLFVRAGELGRDETLTRDRRFVVRERPEEQPGYLGPKERQAMRDQQPSRGEMQARSILGDRLFGALKRLADEYDEADRSAVDAA